LQTTTTTTTVRTAAAPAPAPALVEEGVPPGERLSVADIASLDVAARRIQRLYRGHRDMREVGAAAPAALSPRSPELLAAALGAPRVCAYGA